MDPRAATVPEHISMSPPGRAVAFFGLAYALSWAWLIPIAVSGGLVAPGWGWPTHVPALAGPAVAAVAVTFWCEGRQGLARLGRRIVLVKVAPRWWVFALSPLLLLAPVLLVGAAGGRGLPAFTDFAVFNGLPASWGVLGVAAAVLLVNGFGEEIGWRGFALPLTQSRFDALSATLIVAALWTGWHAPMFLVLDSFRGFTAGTLAGWVIGLFCGAIVLTWLYNRTGGSVALVAVWHTCYNLVSATKAAEGMLAATFTTMVIVLAMVLLGLEIRAKLGGAASVLGPRADGRRPAWSPS